MCSFVPAPGNSTTERMRFGMIQRAGGGSHPCELFAKRLPIIVRMDAGFLDQAIFEWCEAEQVGYICGGKLYAGHQAVAAGIAADLWSRFGAPRTGVAVRRVADRRGSWKRFGGRSSVGVL